MRLFFFLKNGFRSPRFFMRFSIFLVLVVLVTFFQNCTRPQFKASISNDRQDDILDSQTSLSSLTRGVSATNLSVDSKNGKIYDSSGQLVNLYGVNYFVRYWLLKKTLQYKYNMTDAQVNEQIKKEIDKDLDDLVYMGVNFIRVHIYEMEITDLDGTLRPNVQLDLMGYLLSRLQARGITFMLTPITGFFQPYFYQVDGRARSYSSYYSKKTYILGGYQSPRALGVEKNTGSNDETPSLWARQEKYLNQLFAWINPYTGKPLGEDSSLGLVEVFNEPEFWPYSDLQIAKEAGLLNLHSPSEYNNFPKEKLPAELRPDWDAYDARDLALVLKDYQAYLVSIYGPDQPFSHDTPENYGKFVYQRTRDYIETMSRAIRGHLRSGVLVGASLHSAYPGNDVEGKIRKNHLMGVADTSVNFLTHGFYPGNCKTNPCYSDSINYLSDSSIWAMINDWGRWLVFGFNSYMTENSTLDSKLRSKGRVIYEFGAIGAANKSYAYTAMAREMKRAGVQAAAMFIYNPRTSSPYNGLNADWGPPEPEVLCSSFLNLFHTPRQAMDFMISREVFRSYPEFASRPDPMPKDNQYDRFGNNTGEMFVSYLGNLVSISTPQIYMEDNPPKSVSEQIVKNPVKDYSSTQAEIYCVGNCRFWEYDGTGIVKFKKTSKTTGVLTVFPDVWRKTESDGTFSLAARTFDAPVSRLVAGSHTLRFTKELIGGAGSVRVDVSANESPVSYNIDWGTKENGNIVTIKVTRPTSGATGIGNKPTITWTSTGTVANFIVDVSEKPGFPYFWNHSVAGAERSIKYNGSEWGKVNTDKVAPLTLVNGKKYYIRVAAFDENWNYITTSPPVSFTVAAP